MAGYSGTPLARKLGIKPGHAVAVLGLAPASFEGRLELPEGARIFHQLRPTPFDVIVLFVDRLAELEARFSKVLARLHPEGGLWVAWPKKSSRRPTDITEDVVRRVGLAGGLVDNKVCAIDEVWSGLRLVVRVENREAVAYRAEPPAPKKKPRARSRSGAGGSSSRAAARASR
ncbi:MAG TPA: hypothetical protein VHE35_02605 [Kofleriaceae bacterium]|nr:hypothetical protein [Kofleriaceae bacterium]